jgi:hypothetical protein
VTERDEIPPGRTVADLIAKLSTMDPKLPVVLSQDAEGNGYNYWSDTAEEAMFEGTYNGDITLTPEQYAEIMAKPESERGGYTEDDEPMQPGDGGTARKVVVLWPI